MLRCCVVGKKPSFIIKQQLYINMEHILKHARGIPIAVPCTATPRQIAYDPILLLSRILAALPVSRSATIRRRSVSATEEISSSEPWMEASTPARPTIEISTVRLRPSASALAASPRLLHRTSPWGQRSTSFAAPSFYAEIQPDRTETTHISDCEQRP